MRSHTKTYKERRLMTWIQLVILPFWLLLHVRIS